MRSREILLSEQKGPDVVGAVLPTLGLQCGYMLRAVLAILCPRDDKLGGKSQLTKGYKDREGSLRAHLSSSMNASSHLLVDS